MHLAAGLCLNPLGKLERSPRPHSGNWRSPTSKVNEGKLWKGEGRGGEKREGGIASSLFNFWLRACILIIKIINRFV